MNLEDSRVLTHAVYAGDYRLLVLKAPQIAAAVVPGQFVHVLVPDRAGLTLRRPFSVFGAEGDEIRVLYKPVGRGTRAMAEVLDQGDTVSVMGPLGNGFPAPDADHEPALVAGGYGVAPLLFLARRAETRGTVFIGGRGAADVLCAEDFRALEWEVRVTTEDGALGAQGLVTEAVREWLDARSDGRPPEFFACGPDGMLRAVGELARATGNTAWVSMDRHMACGVGACLACVLKVRRHGAEKWVRACRDGPVFDASELVWE